MASRGCDRASPQAAGSVRIARSGPENLPERYPGRTGARNRPTPDRQPNELGSLAAVEGLHFPRVANPQSIRDHASQPAGLESTEGGESASGSAHCRCSRLSRSS